jgi:hypothetical protein
MTTASKRLVRVLIVVAFPLASLMFALVFADALNLVSIEASGSPNDPPPSPEARAGAAAPREAVYAAGAFGVLIVIGSGLVALMQRPERRASAYQILAASLAMLAATAIVGNPDNFGGQAGYVDPAFLILALPLVLAALLARPWRGARVDAAPGRLLFGLALFGAIPGIYYGIQQGLIQRNTFPPVADPHHQAHWYAMSVAAFIVVLVIAAAAMGGSGWRLSAISGGVCAILIGGASLASSESASALHQIWAIAASVWGVLAIAVAWRGRMSRQADGAPRQRAGTVGAD